MTIDVQSEPLAFHIVSKTEDETVFWINKSLIPFMIGSFESCDRGSDNDYFMELSDNLGPAVRDDFVEYSDNGFSLRKEGDGVEITLDYDMIQDVVPCLITCPNNTAISALGHYLRPDQVEPRKPVKGRWELLECVPSKGIATMTFDVSTLLLLSKSVPPGKLGETFSGCAKLITTSVGS